MQTNATIEVAKKAGSELPPEDVGQVDNAAGALFSTYNQEGIQSNDSMSTISTGQILPQEYRFDQEQVTANMAAAISSDVQEMTEAELLQDETFAAASMRVNKALYGQEFNGSNEEAAQGGIDLMRKVDNILLNPSKESMLGFSMSVQNMEKDDAIAALYMMDMFEAKNATMSGFADALGYMGLDAANYIGVATLGWAFGGKTAAKAGARAAMKQTLQKIAFSNAGVGAIEGAGYTAAFEHGKQNVSEAAGQGYDGAAVGTSAAIGGTIGAAAGKYLPEVFDYVGSKMGKWLAKDGSVDIAKVKADADAGDTDAAGVLNDIGLLEGYFGRTLDAFEKTPVGRAVTGVQTVVDGSGKVATDKTTLYHGTNAEFDTFDRVGDKITSLGYGHYFTPDENVAKQYGKNIKKIELDNKDILNLDKLTDVQRKEIIKELDKVVPENIKAGYGEVKRIDITDMDDKKSLELFKQKKEETKDNWHDRAKASIETDGDKTYIQWMEAGLDGATDANLKNLVQEYNQGIFKSLGYKAVRNGSEVAIYDTGFVNKMLNESGAASKADELITASAGMTPKQKQRHFGAAMRDATPEDRTKYIAAMKADAPAPKPKTAKQQEKIAEQEDFNSQFYSKLEHEVNKIPDDMKFETSKDLADYLRKQGVKQDEIAAQDFREFPDEAIEGKDVKFFLGNRPDKIQKRVYTEEDFGGSEGSMDRSDWESEWTTETQGEVSIGEMGYGTRISDDYTGQEGEIGYSYDYDRYVDENGNDYTYDEVKTEYLDNYGDDYKATAADELADELDVPVEEVSDSDILERAWELAENDGAWNDYYYSKNIYETNDGRTFDDLDEAIEHTYDNMFDDYQNIGGEREGDSFENYTVDGGDNYRMEVYQMEDFTSPKELHQEPHLGEDYSNEMDFGNENVQVHARVKTREDADGNTGDVLEEVQSQWEQDWRGQGGDTPPSEKVVKDAEARTAEIKELYKTKRVEKSDIVEKINDEKVIFSDLDKEEKYISQETDMAATDEAAYIKEIEKIMKAQNDSVLRKTELERDMRAISDEIVKLNDEAKKLEVDVIDWKPAALATPPIQKRTQYEKVVLLDNILNSIKDGKDYFGWINGHIQNGSATPQSQMTGMTQAYDKEMPRIVQKATGETPYMANFSDGTPVEDDFGKKIYWDKDKVQDENYYNAQNTGAEWYWRIDLTDKLKAKLKDAKIQMYGVGGAALVGANGANLEGENNANTEQ